MSESSQYSSTTTSASTSRAPTPISSRNKRELKRIEINSEKNLFTLFVFVLSFVVLILFYFQDDNDVNHFIGVLYNNFVKKDSEFQEKTWGKPFQEVLDDVKEELIKQANDIPETAEKAKKHVRKTLNAIQKEWRILVNSFKEDDNYPLASYINMYFNQLLLKSYDEAWPRAIINSIIYAAFLTQIFRLVYSFDGSLLTSTTILLYFLLDADVTNHLLYNVSDLITLYLVVIALSFCHLMQLANRKIVILFYSVTCAAIIICVGFIRADATFPVIIVFLLQFFQTFSVDKSFITIGAFSQSMIGLISSVTVAVVSLVVAITVASKVPPPKFEFATPNPSKIFSVPTTYFESFINFINSDLDSSKAAETIFKAFDDIKTKISNFANGKNNIDLSAKTYSSFNTWPLISLAASGVVCLFLSKARGRQSAEIFFIGMLAAVFNVVQCQMNEPMFSRIHAIMYILIFSGASISHFILPWAVSLGNIAMLLLVFVFKSIKIQIGQ